MQFSNMSHSDMSNLSEYQRQGQLPPTNVPVTAPSQTIMSFDEQVDYSPNSQFILDSTEPNLSNSVTDQIGYSIFDIPYNTDQNNLPSDQNYLSRYIKVGEPAGGNCNQQARNLSDEINDPSITCHDTQSLQNISGSLFPNSSVDGQFTNSSVNSQLPNQQQINLPHDFLQAFPLNEQLPTNTIDQINSNQNAVLSQDDGMQLNTTATLPNSSSKIVGSNLLNTSGLGSYNSSGDVNQLSNMHLYGLDLNVPLNKKQARYTVTQNSVPCAPLYFSPSGQLITQPDNIKSLSLQVQPATSSVSQSINSTRVPQKVSIATVGQVAGVKRKLKIDSGLANSCDQDAMSSYSKKRKLRIVSAPNQFLGVQGNQMVNNLVCHPNTASHQPNQMVNWPADRVLSMHRGQPSGLAQKSVAPLVPEPNINSQNVYGTPRNQTGESILTVGGQAGPGNNRLNPQMCPTPEEEPRLPKAKQTTGTLVKTLALGFTPNTNLHFPAGQEDDTDSDDLEHEASMEDFETFLDGLQGKSFAEMKQLLMEERAEIMRVMLDQETTIRDRDRAAAETLNNSCADISWITATVSKDPDMIEYTGPIIKYLGKLLDLGQLRKILNQMFDNASVLPSLNRGKFKDRKHKTVDKPFRTFTLKAIYKTRKKLVSAEYKYLSNVVGWTERSIRVWFSNQRCRARLRDKLTRANENAATLQEAGVGEETAAEANPGTQETFERARATDAVSPIPGEVVSGNCAGSSNPVAEGATGQIQHIRKVYSNMDDKNSAPSTVNQFGEDTLSYFNKPMQEMDQISNLLRLIDSNNEFPSENSV